MKALIITIATGSYKKYIPDLIKSIDSCYSESKSVCPDLLYLSETDDEIKDLSNLNVLTKDKVLFRQIEHMPWPLVTFLKFHWLSYALEDLYGKYNIIIYCDAVMRLNKIIPSSRFSNKFVVYKHFLWDYISMDEKINLHNKNESSISFIPNEGRKVYIHAGVFLSSPLKFMYVINLAKNLVEEELKNNTIPTWHDESVLNYLLTKQPKLFRIVQINDIYDEAAPMRYLPKTKENFTWSFVDAVDCQNLKH